MNTQNLKEKAIKAYATIRSTVFKNNDLLLYTALIILLNIAGVIFFARFDLTGSGAYSLSKVSEEMVENLVDPLEIKVFYTKNLPRPYDHTATDLEDLFSEYRFAGHNVSLKMYNCGGSGDDEKTISEEAKANIEEAGRFGISAVQIQDIAKDKFTATKGYLGVVIRYGTMIEKIPFVDTTDGLEYKLTSILQKMNSKITTFQNLKENVKVDLYLPSGFKSVAPFFQISGIDEIEGKLASGFSNSFKRCRGRIDFKVVDPTSDAAALKNAEELGVQFLAWRAFTDPNGIRHADGKGCAVLVFTLGSKSQIVDLLESQVALTPRGFMRVYQVADLSRGEELINSGVDSLLEINDKVSYIADKGSLQLNAPMDYMAMMQGGQQQKAEAGNFNDLVSKTYSINETPVSKLDATAAKTLLIAGPKESFSDSDLFRIDQFLMRGGNLVIFLDSFKQEQQPNPYGYGQPQMGFVPLQTGLEKLLMNYGLTLHNSIIMDKSCYKAPAQTGRAGGQGDQDIFFIPKVTREAINRDNAIFRNLSEFYVIYASPITVHEETLKKNGLKSEVLFSSSAKSWEIKDRFDVQQALYTPAPDEKDMASFPLAVSIEGEFPSYFADKGVPSSVESNEASTNVKAAQAQSSISGENALIKKGKRARVTLIGTSSVLKNEYFDENERHPSYQFGQMVMNIIDRDNSRSGWALLRTKAQRHNPIKEYKSEDAGFFASTFRDPAKLKIYNIAGLPLLVILTGLIVFFRRQKRRRKIEASF